MSAQGKEKLRIIFLCSYNSVRSQIAEGLMRHLFGTRYDVFSAGVARSGVNPYAVAVMKEIGIDISGQRSKSLLEFKGRHFDVVVTLCDNGKDACLSCLPEGGRVIHYHVPPPHEIGLSNEDVMREFREVREQIKNWLIYQFG